MKHFRVRWEIDSWADTPEEAAEKVWQDIFNREWPPMPDSACVFTVDEQDGSEAVQVDLCEQFLTDDEEE